LNLIQHIMLRKQINFYTFSQHLLLLLLLSTDTILLWVHAADTTTIWLRFDGRSTAYQWSLRSQWRNPLAAVTLIYLFSLDSMQQHTYRLAHGHNVAVNSKTNRSCNHVIYSSRSRPVVVTAVNSSGHRTGQDDIHGDEAPRADEPHRDAPRHGVVCRRSIDQWVAAAPRLSPPPPQSGLGTTAWGVASQASGLAGEWVRRAGECCTADCAPHTPGWRTTETPADNG